MNQLPRLFALCAARVRRTTLAAASIAVPALNAAPLTISFIADRDLAGHGEIVHWTVWAELPEDAPPGSGIVGFSGNFRPHTLFSGIALHPTALVLSETTLPERTGIALNGVEILRTEDTAVLPRLVPLYAFSTEIASPERPIWYDLDATIMVSNDDGFLFYERQDGATRHGEPIRVYSDTVNMSGCGMADLAEPYGVVNSDDLERFIEFFYAGAPIADLAAPFGVVDFSDLARYSLLYSIGCYQTRD